MSHDSSSTCRFSLSGWQVCDLDATALAQLVALEKSAQPLPWSEGMLNEELKHPEARVLGAHRESTLWAFVAFRRIADELWVMNLATHPTVRRQGLAQALLTFGIQEMNDGQISQVMLEVRRGNQPARELYAGLGFEEIGIRPGYYTPIPGSAAREDAVIMRRVILTQKSF